jgi:hypothetical protein
MRVLAMAGAVLLTAPLAAEAQASLETVASSFARHWATGDLEQLTPSFLPDGIRVEMGGKASGVVSVRQAAAGLKGLHAEHDTRSARVDRVTEVGGSPRRGFAEIAWSAAPSGTSEYREYVLFVGFLMEDEGWRVSEVRVIP